MQEPMMQSDMELQPASPMSPSYVTVLSLFENDENYRFTFQCDDLSKYEQMFKIGEGSFGEVFQAREKDASHEDFVAMKRVLMYKKNEQIPLTALREITILQLLNHENIVDLIEVCRSEVTDKNYYSPSLYLVFEFCEHDLAGLILNAKVKFSLAEVKDVMRQLLHGLHYMHFKKILHRDLKPENILITKNGVLKIADFGLSRPFSVPKDGKKNSYTNRVVTLWYRSPELLLGERNYGPAIDMWAAACIMAEMCTRSILFEGYTEQKQIKLISQLCGSLTPDVWPGVEQLDLYNSIKLPKNQERKVEENLMPYVKDEYGCDLLDQLLTWDPRERISADTALDHVFFWSDPMPCDLEKMLSHHSQSMFVYFARQRRTYIKRKFEQLETL